MNFNRINLKKSIPGHIINCRKLKTKKKLWKQPEKIIHYLEVNGCSKDCRYLMKPWSPEGRGATFLKCWKKRTINQNSVFRENILQEWNWNKAILRFKKQNKNLREFIASTHTVKELLNVFRQREIILGGNLKYQGWGRGTEIINIWVNITDYSPLEFFKTCLTI